MIDTTTAALHFALRLLFALLLLGPSVLMAQVQIGSDIEGTSGDNAGHAVSLSSDGRRLAIGAPTNDDNGKASGQVRVFDLNEEEWVIVGEALRGDVARDESGRAVSLSADGNRVAIGAPFNDDNGNASGQVRVFELNDQQWIMVGEAIRGDVADDRSGWAVSLSADGNRVAIGAPGNSMGYVRIFELTGDNWARVGEAIVGDAVFDASGSAVSLSAAGNRVAIGAPQFGSSSLLDFTGRVRIFELIADEWTQIGQDISGDRVGDQSGSAVSLAADGNRVAIGAPFNDDNGNASGQVRVFELTGNRWNKVGDDIIGDASSDLIGSAVSLSANGNRVAIGRALSGQVRVFEFGNDAWKQIGSDIDGESADDESGQAVSLSADGNRVAIGAPLNDANGSDSGQVRVFEFSPVGHWNFQGDNPLADLRGNFPDLALSGTARIEGGLLIVEGNGEVPTGYARSAGPYLGTDLGEKTLVACVTLTGLDDVARAGSVLTLSSLDGSLFDGIVFAELEANRWMAGSDNYDRTQNFDAGFEETSTGNYVQLAISYQNTGNQQVRVVGYRGATRIGGYDTDNPSEFANGDAAVNFGLRHMRGDIPVGALHGAIVEASIYDFVLGEKSLEQLASQCTAPPLLFEDGFESPSFTRALSAYSRSHPAAAAGSSTDP